MHHPGCWVTHSGCATTYPHRSTPAAQAFSAGPPVGDPAPHPGEGTRVAADAQPEIGQAQAASAVSPVASAQPPRYAGGEPRPVIGGHATPMHAHREREIAPVVPPTPPRRYVPPEGEHGPKPMPKVYGGPTILAYWYIPAAVALAIVVAFGVIWGADQLCQRHPNSR